MICILVPLPCRPQLILNDPSSSAFALGVSISVLLVICLSVVSFVLETVPSLSDFGGNGAGWATIEVCCVALFTAEFLARLIVAEDRVFRRSGADVPVCPGSAP
jgi:hypothetical protein